MKANTYHEVLQDIAKAIREGGGSGGGVTDAEAVTTFEVYATDAEIPAGTVDPATGIAYANAVPAGKTHKFRITGPCAHAESDVSVDWGDGTVERIADGGYASETASGAGWTWLLAHTYAAAGRYTVKVTGKCCTGLSQGGTSILSGCFGAKWRVSNRVTSLYAFAQSSLKLLRVSFCEHADRYERVMNICDMFTYCYNLAEVTGMRGLFRNTRTAKRTFQNCKGLVTCDFDIPAAIWEYDGADNTFIGCSKLEADVASLLPQTGFFARKLKLEGLFMNCKKLTGTVPADLLWEDGAKKWVSVESAFKGCPDAIRAQVPVSWGGTAGE